MHQQNNGNVQAQQQGPSAQQMQTAMGISGAFDHNNPQAWAQQMEMMSQNQQQHSAQDDAWSSSSGGRPNPIVPMSLNVDDW
jgi:hypothetical protein